jgi:hypothetical protein
MYDINKLDIADSNTRNAAIQKIIHCRISTATLFIFISHFTVNVIQEKWLE